jgi:hypothetical protein
LGDYSDISTKSVVQYNLVEHVEQKHNLVGDVIERPTCGLLPTLSIEMKPFRVGLVKYEADNCCEAIPAEFNYLNWNGLNPKRKLKDRDWLERISRKSSHVA